jgi:hypothetical protein
MENSVILIREIEKLSMACGHCLHLFSKGDEKGGNFYYCEKCQGARRGIIAYITKSGIVGEANTEMILKYYLNKKHPEAEISSKKGGEKCIL